MAERFIVPILALLFGAILVLLLLRGADQPQRVPYVVNVPAPPTCHETMVPLWESDGQRVECPYKGQTLEPKLYGDRWYAKCSCALETTSGGSGARSGAGAGLGSGGGFTGLLAGGVLLGADFEKRSKRREA
jgi:hypothetical protein